LEHRNINTVENCLMIDAPSLLDLSKYIEMRIFGQRPHIRGRRIPVATLAYASKSQAWGVHDLAEEFSLSENEVLAALLYYAEHQALIDEQEQAYQAELDRAYEVHQP
jgi:uncharacterized protein (DUF433 family)